MSSHTIEIDEASAAYIKSAGVPITAAVPWIVRQWISMSDNQALGSHPPGTRSQIPQAVGLGEALTEHLAGAARRLEAKHEARYRKLRLAADPKLVDWYEEVKMRSGAAIAIKVMTLAPSKKPAALDVPAANADSVSV